MPYSTVSPITYLNRVNFPPDPYGVDHGNWVSSTATSVGVYLGLAGNELWLCQRAGMFHDVGRRNPNWRQRDDGHNVRSARAALEALVHEPEWKALQPMLERLARVIANHDLDGPPPQDPVAIALWDADILDCARLGQGTNEGAQLIQKRYARLISGFARDRARQEKYIARRRAPVVPGESATPGGVWGKNPL